MKKRVLSFFVAIALFAAIFNAVSAAAAPRASLYFDDYAIILDAVGKGKMNITFDVNATGRMTKVGVDSLEIQRRSGSTWVKVDTLYGSSNPDFYGSNVSGHSGLTSFTGTVNSVYRVVMTVYASNSTGSETKKLTSLEVVCT